MKTKSKTAEYYEKNAERWASQKTNSFFHEKQFHIFSNLLKKGDTVIDIGCAYGIHVPLFLGIGRKLKYKGFDVSKNMIKLAKSRYPHVDFKVGDVLTYKTSKKSDAFWAAGVLMHIPKENWATLFKNIERNVKRGSLGYVTFPSERPNPPSEKDQRHFEVATKNEFKKVLSNHGWEVLKSGYLGHTATSSWNWFIVRLP